MVPGNRRCRESYARVSFGLAPVASPLSLLVRTLRALQVCKCGSLVTPRQEETIFSFPWVSKMINFYMCTLAFLVLLKIKVEVRYEYINKEMCFQTYFANISSHAP